MDQKSPIVLMNKLAEHGDITYDYSVFRVIFKRAIKLGFPFEGQKIESDPVIEHYLSLLANPPYSKPRDGNNATLTAADGTSSDAVNTELAGLVKEINSCGLSQVHWPNSHFP